MRRSRAVDAEIFCSDLGGSIAFSLLLVSVVAGAGQGGTTTAQALAAVSILVLAAHAVIAMGWADAAAFAACMSGAATYLLTAEARLSGHWQTTDRPGIRRQLNANAAR